MSNQTRQAAVDESVIARLLRQVDIDHRMLAMIAALLVEYV